MRGCLSDPLMTGMATRIEEMNQLAERSEGFVWRWRGSLTPESLDELGVYMGRGAREHLFYNMSVWRSIEHLRHYTFQTAHAEMLRDRQRWIVDLEQAHLALWW